MHGVKCFSLINFLSQPSFQTAENYEFTEQDVLSFLILWPSTMACIIIKTILNCVLLDYIVQFIFRRYYQHQETDKFNERHSVPVVLIVIKMKLFPEDIYSVFSKIFCMSFDGSIGDSRYEQQHQRSQKHTVLSRKEPLYSSRLTPSFYR